MGTVDNGEWPFLSGRYQEEIFLRPCGVVGGEVGDLPLDLGEMLHRLRASPEVTVSTGLEILFRVEKAEGSTSVCVPVDNRDDEEVFKILLADQDFRALNLGRQPVENTSTYPAKKELPSQVSLLVGSIERIKQRWIVGGQPSTFTQEPMEVNLRFRRGPQSVQVRLPYPVRLAPSKRQQGVASHKATAGGPNGQFGELASLSRTRTVTVNLPPFGAGRLRACTSYGMVHTPARLKNSTRR